MSDLDHMRTPSGVFTVERIHSTLPQTTMMTNNISPTRIANVNDGDSETNALLVDKKAIYLNVPYCNGSNTSVCTVIQMSKFKTDEVVPTAPSTPDVEKEEEHLEQLQSTTATDEVDEIEQKELQIECTRLKKRLVQLIVLLIGAGIVVATSLLNLNNVGVVRDDNHNVTTSLV